MVIFVGYHETSPAYRASIQQLGLVANTPGGLLITQPHGVYVFSPELRNDIAASFFCEWAHLGGDLWRVGYCGPMLPDPLVRNAVILPAVTDVTLVTGND